MVIVIFLRALLRHWWALLGSAAFTVISIVAAWREQTSHWVLVSSLTVGAIMFFIAAFRVWNDEHESLLEEVAKRSRPDVIVVCDWPSLGTRPSVLSGRTLLVKVLSDIPAINVKIQDIAFEASRVAVFDNIPLLERSAPQKANCRIVGKIGKSSGVWDLESFIEDELSSNIGDLGKTESTVQVIVRYKDSFGVCWESANRLIYDFFLRKGHAEHIEIRRAS